MASIEENYCFDVVQQLNALLDVRGTLFMMQLELEQDDSEAILIRESVGILKLVHEIWIQDVLKRIENSRVGTRQCDEQLSVELGRVVEWLRSINSRIRPLENEIRIIGTAKTALSYYCIKPEQAIASLTSNDKAFLYLCASVDDGMEDD